MAKESYINYVSPIDRKYRDRFPNDESVKTRIKELKELISEHDKCIRSGRVAYLRYLVCQGWAKTFVTLPDILLRRLRKQSESSQSSANDLSTALFEARSAIDENRYIEIRADSSKMILKAFILEDFENGYSLMSANSCGFAWPPSRHEFLARSDVSIENWKAGEPVPQRGGWQYRDMDGMIQLQISIWTT